MIFDESKGVVLPSREGESDEYWVSVSDLMSGLMMIFLFVAVSYMIQALAETQKEREARSEAEEAKMLAEMSREQIDIIAQNYRSLQEGLYFEFEAEFRNDLALWDAYLDRTTLSIRFLEPEVLFDQGSDRIKQKFRDILEEFFPRYLGIISKEQYKNDIDEIRIEGHTSSEWEESVDPERAYFLNMELSQNRTRSVLEYVLNLDDVQNEPPTVRSVLTANGLSSSKLIMNNGSEDKVRSRRVEFRVRTNAEKRIAEILATEIALEVNQDEAS